MKLIFLYITLLLGVVFTYIPYDGAPVDLFLLSTMVLPFKTWCYFLIEHIVFIMLCYVIAEETKKYKTACWIFLWLQVGDLIDYILTYNSTWVIFNGFNLTYNVVASVIFTWVIINEYGRNGS